MNKKAVQFWVLSTKNISQAVVEQYITQHERVNDIYKKKGNTKVTPLQIKTIQAMGVLLKEWLLTCRCIVLPTKLDNMTKTFGRNHIDFSQIHYFQFLFGYMRIIRSKATYYNAFNINGCNKTYPSKFTNGGSCAQDHVIGINDYLHLSHCCQLFCFQKKFKKIKKKNYTQSIDNDDEVEKSEKVKIKTECICAQGIKRS